jgi:putative N6-adenine-specific DNA methylase/tRNA (guanine6-N2)-methyltransferase
VSVQHTHEALSRRQARLFQPRAALKPNVAYALLRLAHLEAPGVVLDPFCGSGTILWEAGALWPEAQLLGNDWNEETLAGARENAEAQALTDRVTFFESDVWTLAETLGDRRADLIVTNPPFGVRLASSMDFRPFYRRVLQQFDEVLSPAGRVVMLVLRQSPFNQALREVGAFDVRHVRVVEIGGLYPRVFVLGHA